MTGFNNKRHIDEDMITIRLRVHRSNAPKIKEFAETVEAGEKRNFTIPEVFPESVGKDKQVALRAYRYRENLTQQQLRRKRGQSKIISSLSATLMGLLFSSRWLKLQFVP